MRSETFSSQGGAPEDTRLDKMASELQELRAELDELKARPKRRRRRNQHAAVARGSVHTDGHGPLTRRQLIRLLGGAAAAGATLAAFEQATAPGPAGADGPNVLLANGLNGTGNSAGANATSVTSTSTAATLQAVNTNNGPQLSLVGASAQGPLAGSHTAGDLFLDNQGILWQAFTTGNPAGWAPLTLPPIFAPTTPGPIRVYDSRLGIPPNDVTKGQLQPGEQRTIDLTHNGAVNIGGAYAALINLTVVNTGAVGFIAVFPADISYPGHSNINWFTTGQITANNASTLFDSTGHIKALGGITPTDLVIDVFGLYLA
jgi:hypothetical protein